MIYSRTRNPSPKESDFKVRRKKIDTLEPFQWIETIRSQRNGFVTSRIVIQCPDITHDLLHYITFVVSRILSLSPIKKLWSLCLKLHSDGPRIRTVEVEWSTRSMNFRNMESKTKNNIRIFSWTLYHPRVIYNLRVYSTSILIFIPINL